MIKQEKNPKYRMEMWDNVHHAKLNQRRIERALKEDWSYHICEDCGAVELNTYVQSTRDKLKDNLLCFKCNLWKERAEVFDNIEDSFVIDGTLWTDGGYKKAAEGEFSGCAGRLFTIRTFDGREVTTNNLWCGGDVPKRYHQGSLKDTAEFI